MKHALLFALALATAFSQNLPYTVRHVAGAGRLPFSPEPVNAASVRLIEPQFVAIDSKKHLYVSDSYYHRILRITVDGLVTSIAGTGRAAFGGDGGPASEASLNQPSRVAIGPNDELYFSDTANARVRKVAANGVITTYAGNGRTTATGDNGPATAASIGSPSGLAFDATGNLYISDGVNHVIRLVDTTGKI